MQVQRQIDELLALRASEWFEILKDPSEEERAAFVTWLGESRLHVQEYLEIAAIEDLVGDMSPALRSDLGPLVSRLAASQSNRRATVRTLPRQRWLRGRTEPVTSISGEGRAVQGWRVAAWAACVCLMVAGALVLRQYNAHHFATGIGEQKAITLADASVVTLDADSRIRIDLEESAREIDLRQGEAFFNVAHDTKRPFRVRTRAGVIEAIGTQFNVYARPEGRTRVSVLEGRVRLTASGQADADRILDAGEAANILPDGTIQADSQGSVTDAVAWRERRLVFNDTPLEDIVLEFNRYNRHLQFRLEGLPPGSYRYAGIFTADDPRSLQDLLAKEPDLMVEKRGDEVVVRRR